MKYKILYDSNFRVYLNYFQHILWNIESNKNQRWYLFTILVVIPS